MPRPLCAGAGAAWAGRLHATQKLSPTGAVLTLTLEYAFAASHPFGGGGGAGGGAAGPAGGMLGRSSLVLRPASECGLEMSHRPPLGAALAPADASAQPRGTWGAIHGADASAQPRPAQPRPAPPHAPADEWEPLPLEPAPAAEPLLSSVVRRRSAASLAALARRLPPQDARAASASDASDAAAPVPLLRLGADVAAVHSLAGGAATLLGPGAAALGAALSAGGQASGGGVRAGGGGQLAIATRLAAARTGVAAAARAFGLQPLEGAAPRLPAPEARRGVCELWSCLPGLEDSLLLSRLSPALSPAGAAHAGGAGGGEGEGCGVCVQHLLVRLEPAAGAAAGAEHAAAGLRSLLPRAAAEVTPLPEVMPLPGKAAGGGGGAAGPPPQVWAREGEGEAGELLRIARDLRAALAAALRLARRRLLSEELSANGLRHEARGDEIALSPLCAEACEAEAVAAGGAASPLAPRLRLLPSGGWEAHLPAEALGGLPGPAASGAAVAARGETVALLYAEAGRGAALRLLSDLRAVSLVRELLRRFETHRAAGAAGTAGASVASASCAAVELRLGGGTRLRVACAAEPAAPGGNGCRAAPRIEVSVNGAPPTGSRLLAAAAELHRTASLYSLVVELVS